MWSRWCWLFGFLFVFFFKQKTAYEMRISDWSSDVCSSDLAAQGPEHRTVRLVHRSAHHRTVPGCVRHRSAGRHVDAELAARAVGHHTELHAADRPLPDADHADPLDRKRVVSGKSVSVRVDIGGGRHMKKKNTLEKTHRNSVQHT